MKLVSVDKSSERKDKKLVALFSDGRRVYFGAAGYEDFTIHKDIQRKERYIKRHQKNENWNNPTTPGCLARFILWNKTSLHESIADYKKRFNL